jgi:glycosyltransferase involved in cell wall biosynthesis
VKARPRVLHVLKTLRFGGIETWLVHVLRHREEFGVQHEILIAVDEVGPYEPEVLAMGIPVHKVVRDRGWLNWFWKLYRFLRQEGPFEIVHCHEAVLAAAPIVAVAAAAGVPVRIAHAHEARHVGEDFPLDRRLMRWAALPIIRACSTRRIGISDAAIAEVAGSTWMQDSKSTILLYGFDYSGNDGAETRAADLRDRLRIPPDAKIVGHVGRFAPVKNHDFLLRTFAALLKHRSDVVLVLVGTGDLLTEARSTATKLEIADRVYFAGTSADVPAFMALFDVFLFPSFSEGLGIVVLEAQVAGTPTLMSDCLPHEVIVAPKSVEMLPLSAGPEAWSEALGRLLDRPATEPLQWRRAVEHSQFGIARCVDDLDRIYREELA